MDCGQITSPRNIDILWNVAGLFCYPLDYDQIASTGNASILWTADGLFCYPLDCGWIASTGNVGILWTGIPCSLIYHFSAHEITSALDATNELVHGSELVHCCFANELVHRCF